MQLLHTLVGGLVLQFSSSDITKALVKDGFELVRTKGSHLVFTRAGHPFHVTVPQGRKTLPIGTVRNIYRQANWPWPPS
jgi:predicted RNA binding protein YcfA (HicA-like mRNA interferase family)